MSSTSAARNLADSDALSAEDEAVFAHLQAAFGSDLKSVLILYLDSSDVLSQRLQDAMTCAHWQEAVRTAIAIGKEAETLGFHRVANAARKLADETYHAGNGHALRNDAQMVVLEYERFRLALEMHFPALLARF